MTVTIETLGPSALALEIHGALERHDYDELVPLVKERIERHGTIDLLVVVTDFHGWSPAALWEDLRFDEQHYRDVSRLAIVGSEGSQEWMATVSRPFTAAEVAFYPESEIAAAREWVRSGHASHAGRAP